MKIVIASGIYPPDIGGPATYSQLIAEEFRKKGHDVSVICYSDTPAVAGQEKGRDVVRILRKYSKPIRYFLYFWNLLKLAKDADMIYAQGPLGAGLPAMWVKKILKKKFIIKIVGDYAWEQGVNQFNVKDLIESFQGKKYNKKIEKIRNIQKKAVESADKVIVPSEFLRKIVFGWGVGKNKIKVIYNAGPKIERVEKKTGLEGDIIISAGRLEPWKGFDALEEIMPDLLKENPKFKLIIASKLPHKELMAHFKASKMFVLNSGYEGFSHIILEAIACELPVIISNVCGNPEIVKHGYNGLLVKYNDKEQLKKAILKLWKNKDLQKKFIENGKKTLKKFNLKNMIDKTLEVLMPRHPTGSASGGKLLMITGDRALVQGKKGAFYYMLEEFSQYWERIDIICPKTEQKIFKVHKNVFIHSSPLPIIFHPWFILKKGIEIYKKEKFDLFTIHSYPSFYNDIGGLWLYNKIRVPCVSEVHHIAGYPKAGSFKEWFYKILTRLFIRFFTKKAKAIRVVNQKQVPQFLKKVGIPEKKTRYLPSFYIDLDIFRPRYLPKKYDIVFAGRLVKNKGIFLLLKAIKNPKLKTLNLKLTIIGSGPLKKKIGKYIKKHKLENNVSFAGWLPSIEDVAKTYNQSKIFVMPSFNEGGPRVTLEAMACNVPVITTRVGLMIDIIRHNHNGLFIDWDVKDITEKILILLKDENLRKKIAENGYQTVQQFERKKIIRNYAKAYQNLLHSS